MIKEIQQPTVRSAPKREQLVSMVRGKIVNGVYKPGQRLPTREELEDHYGVGWTTVQKAMDRLREDGFVVPRGRAGTFVAERPPHCSRFALVFRCAPNNRYDWSMRYDAFLQSANLLAGQHKIEFPAYYLVNGHPDEADTVRLIEDARNDRLAGVLFATPPYWLTPQRQLELGSVPAVSLGSNRIPGLLAINHGPPNYLEKCLDLAASRGGRRVAVLGSWGGDNHSRAEMDAIVAQISAEVGRRGMRTDPSWIIPIHPHMAQTGRVVARLMMKVSNGDRPDTILITDDHIIEAVTAGLADTGIATDELDIYGQVNFPLIPPGSLPVTHIGADTYEILSLALDLVAACRDGHPVPDVTEVCLMQEHERKPTQEPVRQSA